MNLRKFAVGLLVVLGILLAAGLLWIESSAFDRWAQRKAVEYARARWNLQVQLQKLHIQVWRQRATVDALSVRRVQDPRPIFRADRVTIEFRVYDLLTPSVDLKEIVAESPEVWIQPEEPGGPGLSSWLWQEASPAKRRLFDLAVGAIRLQEGTLHYGDIRHRLQIASRGLRWRMNFVPQRDLYRIQMALRDTDLSYDQADYRGVQIRADLDWYRQKLEFRDLKLESSVLQATGRGVLEHPGEARYRFDVSGKIRLAHVPLRYRKGLPTAGEVQFEGELSGEGSDYLLRSSIVSPRMELSKFIVEDFRSSLKVRKGQM
ncbi:MAG: hypothetical protein HY652_08135, partial [Acidobacteria bacterium]|nr:hypothetical protein [Acidobacteriota bacterium]